MTETSIENNKALANLKDKLLETMKDKCKIASCWLSLLSKATNPKHTSHFELVKNLDSNRITNLLMKRTIPVTLCTKLLRFRDTDKGFELNGNLLKTLTDGNYIVDIAKLLNKKLMFEFAREMSFDEKS